MLSVIIFLFLTSHFFIALIKTSQFLMWKVQVALEGRRKCCLLQEQLQSTFLKVLVGIWMFCTDQQIIHSTRLSLAWRRKWQPTPLFLLGKSHGLRRLVGYSPWGCKESYTTEHNTLWGKYIIIVQIITERTLKRKC